MTATTIIQAGEDLPFIFDLGGDDTSGYVCTIFVKQFPEDTATISRIIANSGRNTFEGFLTATETTTIAAVSGGRWEIAAAMVNATTVRKGEAPVRFHIAPSWTQ